MELKRRPRVQVEKPEALQKMSHGLLVGYEIIKLDREESRHGYRPVTAGRLAT